MFHNKRDKFGRFSANVAVRAKTSKKKAKSGAGSITGILSVFLLDDSVSMHPKVDATIEGFNHVLKTSKEDSIKTGLKSYDCLATFGTTGGYVFRSGNVQPLNRSSYMPSQYSTALWDAVIATVKNIEMELRALPVTTNVVFTVLTDGENNVNSHLVSAVKQLVEIKKAQGWVINFIGAGEKLFVQNVAESIGIFATNSMNYVNTSAGTTTAFNTMSQARSSYATKVTVGTATADGFFSND